MVRLRGSTDATTLQPDPDNAGVGTKEARTYRAFDGWGTYVRGAFFFPIEGVEHL